MTRQILVVPLLLLCGFTYGFKNNIQTSKPDLVVTGATTSDIAGYGIGFLNRTSSVLTFNNRKGNVVLQVGDLPAMSATVGGAVPTPPNDATKYLNGAAGFTVPAGTYTLPIATSSGLGGVKPDGTSILNTAGVISATAASVGADPSGAAAAVTTTSIGAVPASRTINGYDLTANRSLAASDVGAPSGSGSSTGTNTGDVTLGTANGLSLSGQSLSLQPATNSQPGALTAADHTLLSTALQPGAPSTTTFVNADASSGLGGTGIDGGTIGATVTYSGSGQLTVIKTDSTAFVVAVLPPAGKLICGRSEYDLTVAGEAASFYPDQNGNLNRVG